MQIPLVYGTFFLLLVLTCSSSRLTNLQVNPCVHNSCKTTQRSGDITQGRDMRTTIAT